MSYGTCEQAVLRLYDDGTMSVQFYILLIAKHHEATMLTSSGTHTVIVGITQHHGITKLHGKSYEYNSDVSKMSKKSHIDRAI